MELFLISLLILKAYAEIVQVSIPEEVPPGTFVTKLMFSGEYKLYDINEPYFNLKYDGTVTTKSRIDRESEPFNKPDRPYELTVLLGKKHIQVQIDVIDINDNRPLFKIKQETFSIIESVHVGFEKMLPEATDIDYGINSTQGYRIESGNIDNTFEIVVLKPGNRKFFNLKVKRALDREITPEFDLQIVAYDGAFPPKTDALFVKIIVEDENDCSPEFNQTRYYASVREDAPIGYKALTVKATDRDTGPNARIVYSFDSSLGGDNQFMINKYTGDITLQGKLDYETTDSLILRVVARDEATNPRTAMAWVTINLIDVNDNQPKITILFKSSTDTVARVDEDASPNSPVAIIQVSDKDSGKNGEVTCEMSSKLGMDYFKLVKDNTASNMWHVQVRKPPSRDVASEYTLSITAHDNGDLEQKVSYTQFKVIVMDINDHYPMFDPPSYQISILENTSPGTDIITVKATDKDDGAFGDITYKIKSVSAQDISSDPLSWFDITPKTGIIRNRIKLDREKTPDINMVIQAIDGGTPPNGPHIATATVVIKLLDENDNIPVFPQDIYEANIKNNVPVGTEVIQVLARDYDDGAFGAVDYDMTPGPDTNKYFKIHRTNGMISVAGALPDIDYQVIVVEVLATDGGGRVGKCKVNIAIYGENKYAPILDQKKYVLSVNENVKTPKSLLIVTATDQDVNYFGEILFELQGNTQDKFTIDKDTGELSVVKPLDYETTKSYKFFVRVFNNFDGTQKKKEDKGTVEVIVNDMNDEPPQFAFRRYNLTAYTLDDNGTVVDVIKAVDPDSSSSGKVTYRLIGGNEHKYFKLKSTENGAEIIINGNLQYMAGKSVNLVLEAQDDNTDTFNGDQTVLWIQVVDGKGEYAMVNTKTWIERYLPFIIGIGVFVCVIFIVIIVVVCNRSQKHSRQFSPGKLPAYDGYDFPDFDEQVGIEPDTIKAYNIDGGGECDRLSAFEALSNQLQSLQYDYIDKPKNNPNNYYSDYEHKKLKSHLDSEGYFSLSDPAFNESPKFTDNNKSYINTLLNNSNMYSNMQQPVKCDEKYVPLSPPPSQRAVGGVLSPSQRGVLSPDCKDFVRSLPPLDSNFLPMSPPTEDIPEEYQNTTLRGRYPPPSPDIQPDNIPPQISSLSSLISSQSRPANDFTRLPTSLIDSQSEENNNANNARTSSLSINSDHSADL